MHLRVEAPGWIDVARARVFCNGECIQTLEVTGRRGSVVLVRELQLEAKADCWFVVTAEGDKGMSPVYCDDQGRGAVPFAATNPFWVRVSGDPKPAR